MSSMDTARIPEWNMWYHVLNCGFPLKVSGETDFPCMSGNAVGQGRVYVAMTKTDKLDYTEWCKGLAAGRSYISDGYAHSLALEVSSGESRGRSGDVLKLTGPVKLSSRQNWRWPARCLSRLRMPRAPAKAVSVLWVIR